MAEKLYQPGMVVPWVAHCRPGYTPLLGRATAERSNQLRSHWMLLQACYAEADVQERDAGFLRGFFATLSQRDGALADEVLTGLASAAGLEGLCLELHASQSITEKGAERLTWMAEKGLLPAERFDVLKFGKTLDGLLPIIHTRLLRAIAALPDGVRVAVDLHDMRLHGLNGAQVELDPHARALCAELLMQMDRSFEYEAEWSRAESLVKPALTGERGRQVAAHLARLFIERYAQGVPGHAAEAVVRQLFAAQPLVALDAFSRVDDDQNAADRWFCSNRQGHPISAIPDALLLSWAVQDAAWRDRWLADRIVVFSAHADGLTPLARALLDRALDRAQVLEAYESAILPTSWSGSYATAAQSHAEALTSLLADEATDVVTWARTKLLEVQKRIAWWEQRERQQEQCFE